MVPALAQLMQPLTRVASLLNTIPKIEPHVENMGLNLAPEKFVGKIEFKDVDFTYPSERQKQVLYGLSFTVEPQTKVAFVGKAGCGLVAAHGFGPRTGFRFLGLHHAFEEPLLALQQGLSAGG